MNVQCLQCLRSFPWESFVYRNAAGEIMDRLRNPPTGKLARVRGRMKGDQYATPHERADILARGLELHCPQGHWVPADITDNPTHVIGLIGPPGSSKSHYLAAAIGQMLDDGLAYFDVTVHLHQWSYGHFQQHYYTPTWGENRVLPKNLPADLAADVNPPIALELQRTPGGRKWNLVFFDSAGEDLISSTAQAKHSQYLSNASAMIFLVEPWSIPGLRSHDGVQQSGAALGGAAGLIQNTAVTLRRIRHLPETHSFDDVPAAVVVAKSDQLDGVPDVPREWTTDEFGHDRLVRPDDLPAIRRRSEAIAPFLEDHAARNLINTVWNAFPRHSYHMVSATGGPPVDGRHYAKMAPRRVLDPVVSLLVQMGVFDEHAGQA